MLRLTAALLTAAAVCAASRNSLSFSGDLGLKPAEIRRALRATGSRTLLPAVPGLWAGWRMAADYRPDAAGEDAARLRSLYFERGYLGAEVRVRSVDLAGGRAHIRFAVYPGPRYRVRQIDGEAARPEMQDVCRRLFQKRRRAERNGVLDFAAGIEFQEVSLGWVNLTTSVSQRPAYRTGRIEFLGNHHFGDETLRRMLRLSEGEPLDPLRLRQSLARLNRTGWFEALTPGDTVIHTAPDSDTADVTIPLKETRHGNWSFSGPAGPMSIGGPLRFTLGSRLPAWGRGVLELSTYTASANLFLFARPLGALIPFLPNRRFVRLASIERPVLPGQMWLSGFTLAPQLGWPAMAAGYGIAHSRSLLQQALESDRDLTPDLPVTVLNASGRGVLNCRPPETRLDRARQIAGTVSGVLFSFSPF